MNYDNKKNEETMDHTIWNHTARCRYAATCEVAFKRCERLHSVMLSFMLGKPLHKKSAVQMEFCQIAFPPPPPQANGRFVGTIFAENQYFF